MISGREGFGFCVSLVIIASVEGEARGADEDAGAEGVVGVDGAEDVEGAAGVAGGLDEDPESFDGFVEVMTASICPMLFTVEVNWAWVWTKRYWVEAILSTLVSN